MVVHQPLAGFVPGWGYRRCRAEARRSSYASAPSRLRAAAFAQLSGFSPRNTECPDTSRPELSSVRNTASAERVEALVASAAGPEVVVSLVAQHEEEAPGAEEEAPRAEEAARPCARPAQNRTRAPGVCVKPLPRP